MNDDRPDGDTGRAMPAGFPRRRLVPVDLLDPIILHRCSDASAPVTGGVSTIDDGRSL